VTQSSRSVKLTEPKECGGPCSPEFACVKCVKFWQRKKEAGCLHVDWDSKEWEQSLPED